MEDKKQTSQSIYVTLDTLTTETSVPGQTPKMQSHSLPRSAFPTSEQFESAEKLEAWARETGVMHACLQKGIQKHLIDIRAAFKACKKADTWSNEYGQANVNAYEWTITTRPNAPTAKVDQVLYNKCMGLIAKNVAKGMKEGTIRDFLEGEFAQEIIDQCFDTIKQAK